jgi:hypothetical protein
LRGIFGTLSMARKHSETGSRLIMSAGNAQRSIKRQTSGGMVSVQTNANQNGAETRSLTILGRIALFAGNLFRRTNIDNQRHVRLVAVDDGRVRLADPGWRSRAGPRRAVPLR